MRQPDQCMYLTCLAKTEKDAMLCREHLAEAQRVPLRKRTAELAKAIGTGLAASALYDAIQAALQSSGMGMISAQRMDRYECTHRAEQYLTGSSPPDFASIFVYLERLEPSDQAAVLEELENA